MVNTSSKQSHDSLEHYLKELSHAHPLSAAEEFDLAVKMKRGDLKARNRLIKANLRFVVNVALKYRNQGVALADLISAGNMGLITATERFDETRGYKFISYAVWWIRQSILQTLAEQGRMIRLPINRQDLLRRIKNFSDQYQCTKGHAPTETEIAKRISHHRRPGQRYAVSQSHRIFSGQTNSGPGYDPHRFDARRRPSPTRCCTVSQRPAR